MVEARIPNPKGPLVDPKTGVISREWWRFFVSQFDRVGGEGDVSLQTAGDDLTAIEALTGTGPAVRVATNTWTQRDLDAGIGITITNADWISGNPAIAITAVDGRDSATDTITSGTVQTQAGATALTGQFNRVTTHANVDDGVKLPAAVAGLRVTILNDTATADLQVWPATDDAIEAASANAVGVTKIANTVATTYQAVDATTWYITDQHTTP